MRRWVLRLCMACTLALPATASADLFSFWVAAKGELVTGTGDVFKTFDNPVGIGAEAGLELLHVDLYGEALIMGSDQFLFTANLGLDKSFGKKTRFVVGLFTGPMLFVFPQTDAPSGLTLTAEQRTELAGYGIDVNKIETEFAKHSEDQQDINRLAVGWNLVRLRTTLEFELTPVLFVGMSAHVGYHYLLSGEDAAAGAKNNAVDDFAHKQDPPLPRGAVNLIRSAVGAEPVEQSKLDGLNLNAGVFIKVEL